MSFFFCYGGVIALAIVYYFCRSDAPSPLVNIIFVPLIVLCFSVGWLVFRIREAVFWQEAKPIKGIDKKVNG